MFNVNLGSQVESRGEFLQTLFAGALPLRAAAWGDGVKGMLHSLYARWRRCVASEYPTSPALASSLGSYGKLVALTYASRADDDTSWRDLPVQAVSDLLVERLARIKVCLTVSCVRRMALTSSLWQGTSLIVVENEPPPRSHRATKATGATKTPKHDVTLPRKMVSQKYSREQDLTTVSQSVA